MAISKGNSRRFYLTTSSHASYTWLAGEQSNGFNRSAESIDVTDKSNNWAAFIAGRLSATAEVTVNLDNDATAGQHELLSSFHEGETVYCFIGTLSSGSSAAPTEGDMFEAVITAINDSNDKDSVASRSISLQVTGAPTHYPTV